MLTRREFIIKGLRTIPAVVAGAVLIKVSRPIKPKQKATEAILCRGDILFKPCTGEKIIVTRVEGLTVTIERGRTPTPQEIADVNEDTDNFDYNNFNVIGNARL